MATVNFIPCKKQNAFSMRNEIEYILQDFKVCIEPEKFDYDHTINFQTYDQEADRTGNIRLISGKDCCPETAFQEFMATKSSYKKSDQTMFYHYDQAFKDGETISPKTAHEIAVKFAEANYPDFEVVIATHVDNEHLHSHFIINSVSFKTGKKLHEGPKTLLKLRAYSDQICQQYGLTTLELYTGGKSQSLASREYRAAAKGQSWKFALMNAIDFAMRTSGTKQDFIKNMERQGYSVRWEDSRKYITYTCPNTKTCRDIRLHDNRYLKEMMEREFELRRIEATERSSSPTEAMPMQPPPQPIKLCPLTQEKLDNLFYNQSLIWDGIEDLEKQLHAMQVRNESLHIRLNHLPTQSELEQISKSLSQIQQTLSQAGRQKEKHFSLPNLRLPHLEWTPLWTVIPLTLLALAVVWFSLGTLWNGWMTLFR